MTHIMLDLETWGTRPNAMILSIGAVVFDPVTQKLGEEFYEVVGTQHPADRFTVDANTIRWWVGQPDEARKVFQETKHAPALDVVLRRFSFFVDSTKQGRVQLWGNGSDFDNVILGNAYSALDMEKPWSYSGNRCYRTLKSLVHGPKLERIGEHHNALDDAKTQAVHAMKLLKLL